MHTQQLAVDVRSWTSAPLQISIDAWFETGPEAIFRALSDPDQMCRLFPWMDQISLETRQPPLAADHRTKRGYVDASQSMLRRCAFGNGMVPEEEIVAWKPPHFYAYRGIEETHPFGMRGHLGTVACLANEGGAHLLWLHYFDHPNPEAMITQIGTNLEQGINRLLRKYGGHLNRFETLDHTQKMVTRFSALPKTG